MKESEYIYWDAFPSLFFLGGLQFEPPLYFYIKSHFLNLYKAKNEGYIYAKNKQRPLHLRICCDRPVFVAWADPFPHLELVVQSFVLVHMINRA